MTLARLRRWLTGLPADIPDGTLDGDSTTADSAADDLAMEAYEAVTGSRTARMALLAEIESRPRLARALLDARDRAEPGQEGRAP